MHDILKNTDKQTKKSKLAGAKAARLAVMIEHGIAVPDFLVISTKCYRKYLHRREKLHGKLKQTLAKSSYAFLLRNSQHGLAIRSSAPFEDQQAFSFAGQFKTFLGVKGVDNIADSVVQIWQSALSDNVQTYLDQFGFASMQRSIAVILQRMIKPQLAGIVFTRHPVMNDINTVVIEVVAGMGEQLVSGRKEPVRIYVDKSTLACAVRFGQESNPAIKSFVANKNQILQLVRTALKIEKIFGEPQDIEWAIENDRLWILQARPITNSISKSRNFIDKSGRIWTDYFFVERFNKPLSPLGWSFIKQWIEKNAFREPLWYLGKDKIVTDKKLTILRNGHPYTQLKVFQSLYSVIPLRFISPDKKASLLLTNSSGNSWLALLRSIPFLLSRLFLRDANWIPQVHLNLWQRFETKTMKRLKELHNIRHITTDNYRLLQLFAEAEHLTDQFLSLHRWSITFADIFYVLLDKICEVLLRGSYSPDLLEDMLSGLRENRTVQANLRLANLATVLSLHNGFDKKLNSFLKEFGHRAESLDIAEPTWHENPQLVKNLAAQLHQSGQAHNLLKEAKIKSKSREEAIDRCKQAITKFNPLLRPVLHFAYMITLRYAQEFAVLRENQRDLWHRILQLARLSALKIGDNAVADNVLQQKDDVFFLTKKELYFLFSGRLNSPDLIKEKVRTRKEHLNELTFNWLQKTDKTGVQEPSARTRLEGLGVSRGRISGYARLAGCFSEAVHAQKGDILIAHTADPAWTPIFSIIGGLVLEVGGVLSHASIVAREFGLPAITSVPEATKMIRDGDFIEIDGEKGIIQILQRKN